MNIDNTVFLTRVLKLQRDVELPEGTRTARSRNVHIRQDRAEDTYGAAVSFEEAR